MALIYRSLFAFSLCVFSASSSRPQAVSQQQPGSAVEGRVVQEPGDIPIRKVVVRLQNAKGDAEQFTSDAAQMGLDEDMALNMAAVLVGRFGNDGSPGENQNFITSTDSAGHFRIEGVLPGQYVVLISRDGCVPARRKHADLFINVTAGQDLSGLVYKMEAAGFITGKIVDADGDPLSGVTLRAVPKGKAQPQEDQLSKDLGVLGVVGAVPGMATTNDLGEYRISGLRAGQYVVLARPFGSLAPPPSASDKGRPRETVFYVPTYYPGALDPKQASPLQVQPGSAASANFSLLTSRAYRVGGTVVGVGQGGTIMLYSNSGQPQQQNIKEGGRFDFPSLQPGTYLAQVFEQPTEGSTSEPRMLRVPTPIVVNGSDLTDLVLQPLADGGTVTGKFRVDGQDAVDWKQMYVSLLPVGDSAQETAGSTTVVTVSLATQGNSGGLNEDGTFELKNVAPGNYQIAVNANNPNFRDWYTKAVLLAGRDVADPGFTATGNDNLEVVVSAKGSSIDGTVLDSDGKPVPEAFVQTIPRSGKLARPDSYQQGRADGSGHFSLRGLNPGEFIVLAFEMPQDNPRNPDCYEKYGSRGTQVELAEGEKKNVTLTLISEETK